MILKVGKVTFISCISFHQKYFPLRNTIKNGVRVLSRAHDIRKNKKRRVDAHRCKPAITSAGFDKVDI